jgi:hypothetical protein
MTRLLLRWMGLLLIASGLVALLIRLQPRDDESLRQALTPAADCPAPCLLGIRPGLTPYSEAEALLRQHPWVKSPIFIDPINDPNTRYLVWEWTGQQPAWIESRWQGQLRSVYGIVRGITLQTRLTMADIWLLFGAAETGTTFFGTEMPGLQTTRGMMTTVGVYDRQGFLIRASLPRSAGLETFWRARVEIESANEQAIEYFSTYSNPIPAGGSRSEG